MRWPIAIVAGLVVVVLVNAAFLWVALSQSDGVDPSYVNAPR